MLRRGTLIFYFLEGSKEKFKRVGLTHVDDSFMKDVIPYEELGKNKVDRTKEDVVAFITAVASRPKIDR